MGEVVTRLVGLRSMLAGAAVVLAAALMLWGAGVARAGGCTATWNGAHGTDWFNALNWTPNAVPTNTSDACIPNGSFTVVINGETEISTSAAAARSLTVGTGDTVEIEGIDDTGTQYGASLSLSAPSSVASTGEIELTSGCLPVGCTNGASSYLNFQGTTLSNQGTILSDPGTDSGSNPREMTGTLINTGTISLNADLKELSSGSVVQNNGGTITNNGGMHSLLVEPGTTFDQGAGTTSPNTANPSNPAVVMDNPGFNTFPIVSYTGTAASTIVAHGGVHLGGNLATGQNLVASESAPGCGAETLIQATSDFTNAGTITLTGAGCSGLQFAGHILTNTGTINATSTGSGVTREIKGSLINSGTLSLLGDTAFDGSGASLSQTAGTTTIGAGKFLDLTGSNGTFELHGGLIQAPGSTHANQSGITGNLNNTGGNVAPGSTTTAGDLAILGQYSQGAGGTLTSVLDGTATPGTSYSQLGVTQGSTLGGTLDIVTHAGFTPVAGNLFTVLGGSTDSGKFAHLVGQFLPGGTLGYKPLYQSNNVTLQASPREKLTVKLAGTKKGSVTSSPAGINCGTTCVASFFKPQAVTLTEHPVSGHKFTGWSGACTGKTTTCKVTMTAAKSVTATFS